jgi:hypothetical protein
MAITSLSTSSLVSGVKRRRVWDQTATTDGFFQIATTTLNTTASSITFSSIPQDYTHLQIRGIWKVSSSGVLKMQFNSDTGANYKAHYLAGDGSTAYANVTSVSPNAVGIGYVGASTAFMVSVCDILDYANTNKYKTIRCLNGNDRNGAGDVELDSGVWLNTAAITSITLTPQTGTLSQYSSLALYGIKG